MQEDVAEDEAFLPGVVGGRRRVTAVLDTCDIRQADYFGYSMGGWIGFGLAKYAPERLRSLKLKKALD